MNLALKLVWHHRASWLAVLVLTTISTVMLLLSLHAGIAYTLFDPENVNIPLDVLISVVTIFLITQSIAALCLETQAHDLALIKTCGASTGSLRKTLILEVILVVCVGYILGSVISLAFRDTFAYHSVLSMTEEGSSPVGFQARAHIEALAILSLSVIAGAWSTVKRVSRQNVVEALQGNAITTKKRKKTLRIIVSVLSALTIIGTFVLANSMDVILKFALDNQVPKEIWFSLLGLPMLAGVTLCLASLTLLTSVAPNLYQAILTFITKRFPKNVDAPLQVGFNLARFNAAKYSGSITPIIAFITVIIMVFTAIDSSGQSILAVAEQNGIDTSNLEQTNYTAITFLIGPAVVIAIVGALCTIMMSGRNRIYVNKLTGVLGADDSTRLRQGLAEMFGYMIIATLLTLIIMLLTGLVSMIGNSKTAGIDLPFVVSWGWWLIALAVAFLVISLPAFYASYRSKRLDSKEILETFGE